MQRNPSDKLITTVTKSATSDEAREGSDCWTDGPSCAGTEVASRDAAEGHGK